MLVASREDVDASSAWNHHLLAAIPDAFLQAVYHFNKGELRYKWLRYLPDQPFFSGFFEQLAINIMRKLSQAYIIESRSGVLTMASKLKYLGSEFRDTKGEPFVQSPLTAASYISEKYGSLDKAVLQRLGIRPLSSAEFVADLRLFISTDTSAFQAMPSAWHISLASALSGAMEQEKEIKADLMQLPIIPLKNGRWIAAIEQQTYFTSAFEPLRIPNGTLIGEIDPDAVVHEARKNLFHNLGARTYSRAMVCEAIIQEQQATNFDANAIHLHDHITRAVFLFESGWENSNELDMWVATEDGSARRGSETYILSKKPRSARKILVGRMTSFNFLNEGYTNAAAIMSGDWNRWLLRNLGLAEFPRLVTGRSPKLVLATDFRVLRKEDPMLLLLVLRDDWDLYSKFFLPSEPPNYDDMEAKANLRAVMAAIEVPCVGGHLQPLGQTTLPTTEVISGVMENANFISLPEPEDPRWHFLSHFGVVTNPGVDQFVKYLRQAKAKPCSFKRISDLYRQLQILALTHRDEIR